MCILDKIVCVHNCLETAYIYVFLMTVRRLYVGSCVHIWAQYCGGVTVLLCFTEKKLDCPVNLAVRVWTTSALPRPWWLIKKELFSPNQHGCNCMRQKLISCHSLALWRGSENTVHVFFLTSQHVPYTTICPYGRPTQTLYGPDQSGRAFVIIITKQSTKHPSNQSWVTVPHTLTHTLAK